MHLEELFKRLRSIMVWTPQNSTAREKIRQLIIDLGGNPKV
jgi:hypothetical protein